MRGEAHQPSGGGCCLSWHCLSDMCNAGCSDLQLPPSSHHERCRHLKPVGDHHHLFTPLPCSQGGPSAGPAYAAEGPRTVSCTNIRMQFLGVCICFYSKMICWKFFNFMLFGPHALTTEYLEFGTTHRV